MENADAPILDREMAAALLHWYVPDVDMGEPAKLPVALAPANADDLSGLPPTFIGTAGYDPLRDDGARYTELLRAAGVPVELSNEPTMVHGYVSFALVVPAAAEATNRGLAVLNAALHPGEMSDTEPSARRPHGGREVGTMAGAQSRCGARSLAAVAQQERT